MKHRFPANYAVLAWVGFAALAAPISTRAQGRGGRGPAEPPRSPQAAAPIDLTGYWVSLVTEDWRWRMVTPPRATTPAFP